MDIEPRILNGGAAIAWAKVTPCRVPESTQEKEENMERPIIGITQLREIFSSAGIKNRGDYTRLREVMDRHAKDLPGLPELCAEMQELMRLATQAAEKYGSCSVEPEHMLVAAVRMGILQQVDVHDIHREMEARTIRQRVVVGGPSQATISLVSRLPEKWDGGRSLIRELRDTGGMAGEILVALCKSGRDGLRQQLDGPSEGNQ